MVVILHFRNIANMNAESKTFYLKLNDVSQEAIDEYVESCHVREYDPSDAEVQDVKWQRARVERLGKAQASMMSARTRTPYIFSGFELPERLEENWSNTEPQQVPYFFAYPVWDWKSLVADDYLSK